MRRGLLDLLTFLSLLLCVALLTCAEFRTTRRVYLLTLFGEFGPFSPAELVVESLDVGSNPPI